MEVANTISRGFSRGAIPIYPCKAETLVERPPKDDAIVLNSTCLISGFGSEDLGSMCIM